MSLVGAYDTDNIFAKIIRGEARAARIFEDSEILAFLDVFPQSRGHCLVVHKQSRARNLLEIEAPALMTLIVGVQAVTRAIRAALRPEAILISQFNGAAAGQTIYHLHFHIIPRWSGQPLGRHGAGGMADIHELEGLASQIAAHLE